MWNGEKEFDIRLDDRNYQKGELLWQREFDPSFGYTGREMIQAVTYLLPADTYEGLAPKYCCMGIKVLQRRGGKIKKVESTLKVEPIEITGVLISEAGLALAVYGTSGDPIAATGLLVMMLGVTPLMVKLLRGLFVRHTYE